MVELLQKNRIVIHKDKPTPEPIPLTKDNLSKYNKEPITPVSKSVPPPPPPSQEADDERGEEEEEGEEEDSHSESGSLSSGKNSVINNIDEVIFTRENGK
jgi:hypothetical protein